MHTPGPWMVEPENKLLVSGCSGRLSVAEVHDHSDTSDQHGATEAEANARLIASAPDLLAACEQAEFWLNEQAEGGEIVQPDEMLRVLRTAIAKAKGQVA